MSGVVNDLLSLPGKLVGTVLGVKEPKAPAAPPPPPSKTDQQVQQAQINQRLAMKKRRGQASTILTSAGGALGAPSVSKKTLLGE